MPRRLARHQRRIGQRLGQFQARRTLGIRQKGLQARPHRNGRIADEFLQLAEQAALPTRIMLGMALRRMTFAEQDGRAGMLQQAVHEGGILGQGQVHQPQVSLAGAQGFVVEAGRIAVEYDLVTIAGQRLLQHMALQRSVGEHGDPCESLLCHVRLTRCWMDSSSSDSW